MAKLEVASSIFLLTFLASVPSDAGQPVPGASRPIIAISQFSISSPPGAEPAGQIRQRIRERLSQLEPYTVSDASDVTTDISTNRAPDFSVWQSHRVKFLLLAGVDFLHDGRLRLNAPLWDVTGRQQIDGQQFILQPADWQRAANELADHVVFDLTRADAARQ
jgi:Tol biopolymer transport system component